MNRRKIFIVVALVAVVILVGTELRFETYRTREGLFRRERFTGRVWQRYEQGWEVGWEPVLVPLCNRIDNGSVHMALDISWDRGYVLR